jgi:5-methylcytosine-specific restriction endonuclease McrA
MSRISNPTRVRYRPGPNNSVLLVVLHQRWGHRCYWCRKPKVFAHMEIDHILSRTTAAERLQELIADLNLPADFDVDGPANLAPICRPCNNEKSDEDHSDSPRMMGLLRKARRHAPAVIKEVQGFNTTGKVGAGLIALINADLTQPAIHDLVDRHVPELARTLAAAGHDIAAEVIADTVEVDRVIDDETIPVGITARVLAAVQTLEQLCDMPAVEVLGDAVAEVAKALCAQVQTSLDGYETDQGPASSSMSVLLRLSLTLNAVEATRDDDTMQFCFAGTFDGDLTNNLVQSAFDGDGLDELQADTEASGRYTFCAVCLLGASGPTCPTFTDIEITDGGPVTTWVYGAVPMLLEHDRNRE